MEYFPDELRELKDAIYELQSKIECYSNSQLSDYYIDLLILKLQQTKNSVSSFSNKFIDSILKMNLTATEIKIILCVARCTVGIGVKSNNLSVHFISRYIKQGDRYTKYALNSLIEKGIVIVLNAPLGKTREICLNQEKIEHLF